MASGISAFIRKVFGLKPKDGEYVECYRNGNKKVAGEYRNGKKDGTWERWYESGARMSTIDFEDGQIEGWWISWFEDGQEASRERWIANRCFGSQNWYPSGQKKAESTSFESGEVREITKLYYENGQVMLEICGYRDESSYSTDYHQNGAKKAVSMHKNQKKEGLWEEWSEDGKKESETLYINGKEVSRKEF